MWTLQLIRGIQFINTNLAYTNQQSILEKKSLSNHFGFVEPYQRLGTAKLNSGETRADILTGILSTTNILI